MLEFLNSSKRIASEIKQILEDAKNAEKETKAQKIKESIDSLEKIVSEESDLFKKIKRNKEGLALQLLNEQINHVKAFAQKAIEFLKRRRINEALKLIKQIENTVSDEEKLVKERRELLKSDRESAEGIKSLKRFVKDGVVILFNRTDSSKIRFFSENADKVYCYDPSNPNSQYINMQMIGDLPNVELKKNLSELNQKVKCVVIEYLEPLKNNLEKYFKEIDKLLKKNGHLIIFLEPNEYREELNQKYSKHINYQKIVSRTQWMVFKK